MWNLYFIQYIGVRRGTVYCTGFWVKSEMVITIAQDVKGCWFESSLTHNMKQKDYHKPGYWKDWYWNRGGREKVQAKRYIREYEREKQKQSQ